MKRFLAFLLAFIMMMSALALVSCEEKTDEEEKDSEESVEDKESEEESETEELDISVYTPDTVVPMVMTPEFLEERVLKAAEENRCSRAYLARIQVSFKKTKLEEITTLFKPRSLYKILSIYCVFSKDFIGFIDIFQEIFKRISRKAFFPTTLQ